MKHIALAIAISIAICGSASAQFISPGSTSLTIIGATTPTSGIVSGNLIGSTTNIAVDSGIAFANIALLNASNVFSGAVNDFAAGSTTAPGLAVGNSTTGFSSVSTTGWGLSINANLELDFGETSAGRFTFGASTQSLNTSGWILTSNSASSTAPTLIPNRTSTTTGFGAQASGNISAILAGTEVARFIAGGLILPTIASDATHTDASVCEDTTTHTLYSGSGTLGICLGTSSARFKSDIRPIDAGIDQLMNLQPVAYHLNEGHGDVRKTYYGFTAEQGDKALPVLTGRDAEGQPSSFDYLGVVPVLVKAVQQLKAENDMLRECNAHWKCRWFGAR